MTNTRREVAITGISIVSSLGQGLEPHLAALHSGAVPVVDTESFAPYPVHLLGDIDYSEQIPKRSDQRQMEEWQLLGVYTAGLALESAGLKKNDAAKGDLELLVAAGGGERDHDVDSAISTGIRQAMDKVAYLNEHLMNDLRPTLFLAQLSNLLAGNISIVHGVTGGSRTFMGEEQAGVDAMRVAVERVAAGQCDAIMVGGAYNAARRDMLLLLECGDCLHKDSFDPVFAAGRSGTIMGSVSAFAVLESANKARERGARIFAEVESVAAGRARREPGGVQAEMAELIGQLNDFAPNARVISAASGVAPWTAEEHAAIVGAVPEAAITATGDLVGHGLEAAFPTAVVLAAALIGEGDAPEVLVTGAGHWRGEGAARLVKPAREGSA